MDNEDSIDVHFDEKTGHLKLDCGAADFARYLETAARHIGKASGVPLERVRELSVHNVDAKARQRDSTSGVGVRIVFGVVLFLLVFFALLGLSTFIAHF